MSRYFRFDFFFCVQLQYQFFLTIKTFLCAFFNKENSFPAIKHVRNGELLTYLSRKFFITTIYSNDDISQFNRKIYGYYYTKVDPHKHVKFNTSTRKFCDQFCIQKKERKQNKEIGIFKITHRLSQKLK